MTADIRILTPRKPKRLVTPSFKWPRFKVTVHLNHIVKFQAKKGKP